MIDELLDSLANPYQLRVLLTLTTEHPVHISDIIDDESKEAARIELYHTHLPKLDEKGFIDWDQDNNVVQRGDRFDEVKQFFNQFEDRVDIEELSYGFD